jgi:hypothetical protein
MARNLSPCRQSLDEAAASRLLDEVNNFIYSIENQAGDDLPASRR